MEINEIKQLAQEDMAKVDTTIKTRLHSDVVLINQLSQYILNSGGKRLRPLLLLLTARACDYKQSHHITLAAVVEFIHTATLLHDDVVDHSELRRGNPTANTLFGNAASVLVGDFLYSRSFQMMVEVNQMRVLEILAEATNILAAGEVMQLMHVHNPDITEKHYMEVIYAKTAKLFEASACLGAIISDQPKDIEQAFANYGLALGTAFQIIDDMLDYSGETEAIGKNIGDDLAEGKSTLPLIYALAHAKSADANLIRHAIEEGKVDQIEAILHIIKETGAIDYTYNMAQKQIELAKQSLREISFDNVYKQALLALADFALRRNH